MALLIGNKKCTATFNRLLYEIDFGRKHSEGLLYQLNEDKQSYTVAGRGVCSDTFLVIPATYNNLPVTGIGDGAFDGCKRIVRVILKNGITTIGTKAFYNCISLTSIDIPDSVTSLGDSAFENCRSLTSIAISDNLTSIGASVFSGCIRLESIIVDADNTAYKNIDGNHLYSKDGTALLQYANNNGATSFTIPSSVTGISSYAFSGCSSLASLTISDSVTSIGYSAFKGCSGLNDVYISDIEAWLNISFGNIEARPTYYGNLHILDANGDELAALEIPDGLTSIGEYAFRGCSSLTNITIQDSVTSIGDYAFDGCTNIQNAAIPTIAISSIPKHNLKTVVITSGTSIDSSAFYNCSSLKSIVIPESVTSIGFSAFYGCPIETATIPALACSYIKNSALKTVVINGGTSISANAFQNCTSLTSVTIGNSITSIGNYAFYGCTYLKEIYFNSTTMNDLSYDNYVFYNAGKNSTGIKLVIGANTTKIPSWLFCPYSSTTSYSPKITSINFEDSSVGTSIGTHAFTECDGLTSVTIPDRVTSIGDWAFCRCSALTHITFGNNVESIGSSVFYECTNLTSVTFNENSQLTSIGDQAFISCTKLASIAIPDSVTQISSSAFSGCTSLTSVTFGENSKLASISSYVFQNCNKLVSIVIPDSVTSVGKHAFYSCTSLVSLTIGKGITSMSDYAFEGCSAINKIYFNATEMEDVSLGNYLFYKAGSSSGADVVVGGNVTRIPQCLFCANRQSSNTYSPIKIKSVTFEPNSVCTSIGRYAFYRNGASLTTVTIPGSVTVIGACAFEGCTGLTSVTLDNGIQTIGESAFENCISLTSIIIPSSITSIYRYAFDGCASLTSVVFMPKTGWTWFGYLASDGDYGEVLFSSSDLSNSDTAAAYLVAHSDKYWRYKEISEEEYNPSNAALGTTFARAYSITRNEIDRITLSTGDEYVFYKFTAPTDGSYDFESFCGSSAGKTAYSYDTCGYLYDSNKVFIAENDDGNGDLHTDNFLLTRTMSAGETVYLVVRLRIAKPGAQFAIGIHLSSENGRTRQTPYILKYPYSIPIPSDLNGRRVYIKFTATMARSYKFYSSGSRDTYCTLYNSDGSMPLGVSNDDMSSSNKNFSITYKMEKDQTVVLEVYVTRFSSLDDPHNTGFSVSVEYA